MDTVDIGIDLGTTFSVIAVQGEAQLAQGEGQYLPECKVTILPTPLGERVIPSALWQDPADPGQVLVGAEAKQKAEEGEAPILFSKRAIGTDTPLRLHDRTLTAREVATHILRYLKDCAERALGKPVRRAVITHPAYFDRNQIEETRQAAEAAGFDMSLPEQLMMEPAAAALAYVQDDPQDPLTVLTYDLGGGTFDVTVVKREQGVIDLKAFDGDHLLGGYNFDRRLVEWIFQKLKVQGRQIPYDDNDPVDRGRRALLLQLAENLKLKLTEQRSPKVPVPVKAQDILVDAEGKKVQFVDRITREEYAGLIRDYLDETLACCRRALAKAGVAAEALDHVLLVGGSTYGPWVQEAVEAAFPGKVQVFNPDLCVAAGAAIRAASLPAVASAGGLELTVEAPATSVLPQVTVSGRVQGEAGKPAPVPLTDLHVVLHTPQRRLEAQPREDGSFLFEDVPLDESEPTAFTVEASDAKGLMRLTQTVTVSYTPEGASTTAITTNLPKPLLLKVAEGFQPLAEEGAPLPKKCEVTLRRLGNEPFLEIEVYQGEEEAGKVRIDNIPADAGAGAQVVVDVEITEKNEMRGKARVLRKGGTAVACETPVRILFPPLKVPSVPELQAWFDELEAKRQQEEYACPDGEQRLRLAGPGKKVSAGIERLLREQPPDAQEVYRALKELDRMVNPPPDDMDPPRATFRRALEDCRDMLAAKSNDPQVQPFNKMLDRIEADGKSAADAKNHKKWAAVNESLNQLRAQIAKAVAPGKEDGGEPELDPTPLLKDAFRQEADRVRRALEQKRDELCRSDKYEAMFRPRLDGIAKALDQVEVAIDKVDDKLEPKRGLAQLRLAARPLPEIQNQIRIAGEQLTKK